MASVADHYQAFAAIVPGVRAAGDAEFAWWRPEPPPPTILFGEIGRVLAEQFEALGEDRRAAAFAALESAMADEDETVANAAAVGLIEALIHRLDVSHGGWSVLEPYLGPRSRAYADAYEAFTRGAAPGVNGGAPP